MRLSPTARIIIIAVMFVGGIVLFHVAADRAGIMPADTAPTGTMWRERLANLPPLKEMLFYDGLTLAGMAITALSLYWTKRLNDSREE